MERLCACGLRLADVREEASRVRRKLFMAKSCEISRGFPSVDPEPSALSLFSISELEANLCFFLLPMGRLIENEEGRKSLLFLQVENNGS